MTTSLALIRAIRARCPANHDADEWLAQQLKAIEERAAELARIERMERQVRDDCRKKLSSLATDAGRVRAWCPHYTTRSGRDSSGGRDRDETCEQCGKDMTP